MRLATIGVALARQDVRRIEVPDRVGDGVAKGAIGLAAGHHRPVTIRLSRRPLVAEPWTLDPGTLDH